MNDLEDALRSELHGRVALAERDTPELQTALIDGIERRLRRTRRHRAQWASALAMTVIAAAVLLVGTLSPIGRNGPTSSNNVHPKTPAAVQLTDTAATPRGWGPVPYLGAQVSVPSTWFVTVPDDVLVCVSHAPGIVFVGARPTPQQYQQAIGGGGSCKLPANVVWLRPAPPPGSWVRPAHLTKVVHGIAAFQVAGSPGYLDYVVPSLGVEVRAWGSMAASVIATLTRSPLSVVLAQGREFVAPRDWQHIDHGGIQFAAPATWRAQTQSLGGDLFGVCDPSIVHRIWLSAAIKVITPDCTEREGLLVNTSRDTSVGINAYGYVRCTKIHELSVCLSKYRYGTGLLTLAVFPPGHRLPVVVVIGLGGSGATARTIFDSIRAP